MSNTKIAGLKIGHFRGITDEIEIDFCISKKPESLLIYGDNGSGKSSVVDALEFVTRGTVHTSSMIRGGDWLYNSVSLNDIKCVSNVTMKLNDGAEYVASLKKIIEDQKVIKNATVLQEFRRAPFILRRKDILRFWELHSAEKLRLFLPYEYDTEEELLINSSEQVAAIEKERNYLKNEKRKIIEILVQYYKFDSDDCSNKNKSEFFMFIKLYNKGKTLKQLSNKHPMKKNLKKLDDIFNKILEKNAELKSAKKNAIEEKVPLKQKERLQLVMKKIAPTVTGAFKNISKTNDFVRDIVITVAEKSEVSLEFMTFLDSGAKVEPSLLFSEANRDLLAFLIYLEYIHEAGESEQAKVLVLDDVFQSVDSTIRFRVMRYIVERFKDWQLIITTHDRLWKEQLVLLFQNHNKPLQALEIARWTFENGPQILGSINNYDQKLLHVMSNGSTADICAASGYLLEYICERLSIILSIRIHRKPGDKYTIGDLWPGVYKVIKNSSDGERFSELNDLVGLRNLAGSHYNEWSLSLSRSEAEDFANAVLNLYYHVCSKDSGKWIKGVEDITEEWSYVKI